MSSQAQSQSQVVVGRRCHSRRPFFVHGTRSPQVQDYQFCETLVKAG